MIAPSASVVETAEDLPAAFASVPPAWRAALPGWTSAAEAAVVDDVRRTSGGNPIGPTDPFRALRLVDASNVKVVIVGQDPYPTAGQADGLCFSAERIAPRPSLRRIFDVLEADRPGWRRPVSGRLDAWAQQGVLLLNTALTVEWGRPGSHLNASWRAMTGQVLQAVSARCADLVVLAWGAPAAAFVDVALGGARCGAKVLQSRHPSNDFKRGFMAEGSHFAATADRVNWWALPGSQSSADGATKTGTHA